MGGERELGPEETRFAVVLRKYIQDLVRGRPAEAVREDGLGSFDEYEMQWRALVLDRGPSGVDVEQFDDHIDEVLESQPVVFIGKSKSLIVKLIV